jgi:DNA polymerase-1
VNSRQRIFLIDGYSNIFRAFYAIRNLSNARGEPTNAVYGFVQMLRKLLRDESPELLGVALDVSGPTVRDEKFEAYKANRTEMPEDLRCQIPWIRQAIEAHRIPILEMDRYEADDVLGTLAKKAGAAGYAVTLVSSDKDLMQLVDENISLYHTGRDKLYDPRGVEEDFGVAPELVTEVLALKGDAVDNIPGVPGIGEKGALQLVRQFGSVEALLDRASEVSRKSYREGLQQHREQALLSKELVTIHTDLPIELEPEKLQIEAPDLESLRELYREMGFRRLLEEVEAVTGSEEVGSAEEVESVAAWRELVGQLQNEVTVALVGMPSPVGVAVADQSGRTWFADFRREGLELTVLDSLRTWLADTDCTLVGHDLKELLRLVGPGPQPKARLHDVMLLSYVLRPSARGHGLAELAVEHLGHSCLDPQEVGLGSEALPLIGDPGMLAYAGERTHLARRLGSAMVKEIAGTSLASVYYDIEVPLMAVLVGMEEAGVLLDTDFLAAMSAELEAELVALETEIYALAGEEFNINSPQQLGTVMFEKLGYPVLKKTRKTKSYSTSAEILQQLAEQGYPLPEHLLRFRELSKLKSTYVDALPRLVGEDGRLHTRFHQAVAATGRLSSANPNLQNIPVRTEQGQRIRQSFVAPPGCALLVADYNQIELRVLAHIAADDVLIEAFRAGEDIHRTTAAAVFGVADGLVTADQRRAAKTINFGIIYGISGFGLAKNLGIRPAEADLFIKAYFEQYAGVKRYIDETLAAVDEEGKVETLYGRVRWLPEVHSSNHNLRENGRRMAINARIQGTAADLMKLAMISLAARLSRDHPDTRLLLTVHDELVLEVPEGDLARVSGAVRQEMEGVAELSVPLTVDLGAGRTWYDAKLAAE